MVPARKSQSRFKWLTTLAKFVTSNSLDLKNPREEPTFFSVYIQNFYLAFCSLRNSGRKKGKMLVVSEYFFSRYKPSQLDFSNCDSEKRILNFELSFMLITHRYNEGTWQLNIDCSLAKRKGRKK